MGHRPTRRRRAACRVTALPNKPPAPGHLFNVHAVVHKKDQVRPFAGHHLGEHPPGLLVPDGVGTVGEDLLGRDGVVRVALVVLGHGRVQGAGLDGVGICVKYVEFGVRLLHRRRYRNRGGLGRVAARRAGGQRQQAGQGQAKTGAASVFHNILLYSAGSLPLIIHGEDGDTVENPPAAGQIYEHFVNYRKKPRKKGLPARGAPKRRSGKGGPQRGPPTKNSATVPGPLCAPMTGPISPMQTRLTP